MSAPELAILSRLVRRVRIRLWLAALRRTLAPGLWATAVILAAGAVARWRLGVPAPVLLAALATAPLLLALVLGLRRRPSQGTALLAADRCAQANALLLSAWDLLSGRPPLPAAAPVVMTQAVRVLPEWEQRICARTRGSLSEGGVTGLWAPLLALLSAVPLLALDPPRLITESVSHTAPPATGSTAAVSGPAANLALQSLVEDLRRAPLAVPEPRAQTASPQHGSGGSAPAAPPSDSLASASTSGPAPAALPESAASAQPVEPPSSATGGKRADHFFAGGQTAGDNYDLAGTGPTEPDAAPQPQTAAPPVPERRIGVARHGALGNLATESGDPVTQTSARPASVEAGSTGVHPAILPNGVATDRSTFAPAQGRLIDRYFSLMQENASR